MEKIINDVQQLLATTWAIITMADLPAAFRRRLPEEVPEDLTGAVTVIDGYRLEKVLVTGGYLYPSIGVGRMQRLVNSLAGFGLGNSGHSAAIIWRPQRVVTPSDPRVRIYKSDAYTPRIGDLGSVVRQELMEPSVLEMKDGLLEVLGKDFEEAATFHLAERVIMPALASYSERWYNPEGIVALRDALREPDARRKLTMDIMVGYEMGFAKHSGPIQWALQGLLEESICSVPVALQAAVAKALAAASPRLFAVMLTSRNGTWASSLEDVRREALRQEPYAKEGFESWMDQGSGLTWDDFQSHVTSVLPRVARWLAGEASTCEVGDGPVADVMKSWLGTPPPADYMEAKVGGTVRVSREQVACLVICANDVHTRMESLLKAKGIPTVTYDEGYGQSFEQACAFAAKLFERDIAF